MSRAHARTGTVWRILAVLLAFSLFAAACGDDDTDASATPTATDDGSTTGTDTDTGGDTPDRTVATATPVDTAPADDVDPDGVLKLGFDMANNGGMNWDTTLLRSPTQITNIFLVWETLLHYDNESGVYSPGLATDATLVDANTIEVTLREGLTFQNGEPINGAAVKATILRNIGNEETPGNRSAFRQGELGAFEDVVEVSDTVFQIKLKTPTAGSFFNLLAFQETMPYPPQAVADGVDFNTEFGYGSGPFEVTEFVPEDHATLVKRDDYWNADAIRLAGVEFVNLVGAEATVNALRTGAVHGTNASQETLDQLQGADLEVRSFVSPDTVFWNSFHCSDAYPAVLDVRVRQALNYLTDGDKIAKAVFGPEGTAMYDYWASGPNHNSELDGAYDFDVDKAKELLADAGYADGLTISVIITAGAGGITETAATIMQQDWALGGVTLELVQSSNPVIEYFIDKKTTSFTSLQTRIWTDKITRGFLPGEISSVCLPQDNGNPEFVDIVTELRGLDPRDPAVTPLWHAAQKILSDGAYGVFMGHGPTNLVWNPAVGDIHFTSDQVGAGWVPDAYSVYIKAS